VRSPYKKFSLNLEPRKPEKILHHKAEQNWLDFTEELDVVSALERGERRAPYFLKPQYSHAPVHVINFRCLLIRKIISEGYKLLGI